MNLILQIYHYWHGRVIALSVIALAILACSVGIGTEGFSVSTAEIGDAWMARDEKGEQRTSVYSKDSMFFVFFELKNVQNGTDIEVRWNALDKLGPGKHQIINRTSLHASKDDFYYFYLSNVEPWSAGSYSVHIYLDENFVQELLFEVR